MDENTKKLNATIARTTKAILDKRRLGLQARVEGLTTYLSDPRSEITPQESKEFQAEIDKIIQKLSALKHEYAELSEWISENIPKN